MLLSMEFKLVILFIIIVNSIVDVTITTPIIIMDAFIKD